MFSFRQLAAVVLAIFIANPLCCCFGEEQSENEASQASCCSRGGAGEEAPIPATCPCCQAKNPRVADGGKAPVLAIDLPELVSLPHASMLARIARTNAKVSRFDVVAASPPPRLRLVVQQRFLI